VDGRAWRRSLAPTICFGKNAGVTISLPHRQKAGNTHDHSSYPGKGRIPFVKMLAKLTAFALVLASLGACAAGAEPFSLPRATPESQGVSSSAVLALVEALDQVDAMNSFMLARHGRVIAEGWWAPYDPQSNHELYSLSKSFTSTAVGIAVAEGRLSIDDEVLKFFPEDAPVDPGANLKAMRVRDLLTMACGHQDEVPSAVDRISTRAFLTNAVPHKPGTHFKYNTPATFMCSAIVHKLTGQTVADYLKPRLFEPLGITQPVWNTNWQGITLGGYGLNVRTEDIARFGQLYLQKGKWQGKQLVPQDWVEMATSKQVSNGSNPKSDWDQGYGFQFWRCRHGAYRGDGAFGQYCIVLPEQDAVIAITSGVKDMQAVLNLIWENLLPEFQQKRLKADAAAQKKLKEKLSSLIVRPAEGSRTSALAAKISGRKFSFPANDLKLESITIALNNDRGVAVTVRADSGVREFSAGHGEWRKGHGWFGTYLARPAAASWAWAADDTLVIKQCFTETPYYVTHKFRFDGDQVIYNAESNVGFRNTRQPQLTGRAE
jgi:CubicO group peptidase (beta-lactamase class C family)